jgi:4-carboxymuconolactone decarboxylase
MSTQRTISPDLRDADDVALLLNGVKRIHRPNRSHERLVASQFGRPGWTFRPRKDGCAVDHTERLRRLAISDAHFLDDVDPRVRSEPGGLDAKTLSLVRLAALVAVGGAEPSYGAQADAAVDAGATAAEIVDVLVGVIPVVGLPCVVAATPKLALALGYDEEAFEHQSGS